MKLSKIIPVCLFVGAAIASGHSASAQINLGAVSTTRLSAATSLTSASVSNALRASTAASVNGATSVGAGAKQVVGQTEANTAATGKQVADKGVSATQTVE